MIAALAVLVLFFSLLLAMLYDIDCVVEEAQHEVLLDDLLDDETEVVA